MEKALIATILHKLYSYMLLCAVVVHMWFWDF